jgi:hypothetical protein
VFTHCCQVTQARCFRKLRARRKLPQICGQSIRKLSARQYEQAHGGAGAVILGHAVSGVTMIYYLSQTEILRDAQERLAVPECFRDCLPESDTPDLANAVASLGPESQKLVAEFLRALGVLQGGQATKHVRHGGQRP